MKSVNINVRTHKRDEFVNVTAQVQEAVTASGIQDGFVLIYVPHTTAGVTINEAADPDVVHDILAHLDKIVPWETPYFRHAEGNAAGHIKSSMMGCSAQVPVKDGRLALGTWQGIFFCEFDGPRSRHMSVHISSG